MTTDIELTNEETLAIDCQGLTYAFAEGLESALDGVDLQLKKGDRCLLVGANGGQSCSHSDKWHRRAGRPGLMTSRKIYPPSYPCWKTIDKDPIM